ncbi:alternative ribosome rescue aminoacyl-tRNA hydrolase ArfB [Maricaulis sp.]|uniref:alternative ribosome rescue aminoacyl-tRNA hydrolase ArfB n=1 Tax=Maricaulis sp. TaxID=1486257 RepID=UPI002616CD45|nr:alternative ribosome rescue aminoacyl-tRNA hydrolase ArfB [Maricaulis sp.]
MRITDELVIDEAEIEERFIRASGPGGQHVNTTDSAVQLRFDVEACSRLTPEVKARLKRLAGSRLTKEGVLVIRADTQRARERNRIDARSRLKALIERALVAPKPRKKSRPSLAAVRRTKEAKARISAKKAARKKPGAED